MFARAAGRNPRRRQRTSSDDSVNPPKAKRQRSVLRQAGESSTATLNLNHGRELADPAAAPLSNDHDVLKDQVVGDSHLPIRSAKPSESSRDDIDGTVVLVGWPFSYASSPRTLGCMATNTVDNSQAPITILSSSCPLCRIRFARQTRVSSSSSSSGRGRGFGLC